jgi:hypothetical protein
MTLFKTWLSKDRLDASDLNDNFLAAQIMRVANEDLTSLVVAPVPVTYSTSYKFRPGTLEVYVSDGPTGELHRKRGGMGCDYVEVLDTNGNGEKLTFSATPIEDSKLLLSYMRANA